jgi:hypothetical protein
MKRLALVAFAMLALGSTVGNATPAIAGPRCGFHHHFVPGHYVYFHHHRHFVRGHCV